MTEAALAARPTAQAHRPAIGGKYALAWPTIAIYAAAAAFNNIAFDRGRLGGSLLSWVLLTILLCVAGVIPLLIARATVLPVCERPARPAWALLTYLVSAAARSSVFLLVGSQLGLTPDSDFTYRIWSPLAGTVLLLAGAEVVVSRVAMYRQRSQQLQTTQRQLREQQAQLLAVAERDRTQIVGFASMALAPEIDRLRQQLEGGGVSTEIAPQLTKLVNDVVRPLSLQITQLGGPSIEHRPNAMKRTHWSRVRLPIGELFLPGATTALMSYVYFLRVANSSNHSVFVLALAPTILINLLGFLLAKRMLLHLRWPVLPAIGAVLGAALVIAAAGAWVSVLLAPGAANNQLLRVMGPPIFGVFCVAVYQVVSLLVAVRLDESEAQSRELDLVTQRARQEMWLNRKRISSHLHGPVQAALQVSAMRLARAELVDRELLDSIAAHIQSTLDTLDAEPETTVSDVERTLLELQEMWQPQAKLSVELSPSARELLAIDNPSCQAVIEVASEAVLNAVKHGDAEEIAIRLDRAGPQLLVLEVRNAGLPLSDSQMPGFGSRTLDELCVRWALTSDGPHTVLRAELVAGDARGLGTAT